MKFDLKTKIVKMGDYNSLRERMSDEKASIMANKFAGVSHSIFDGWTIRVYSKKGDVVSSACFSSLSTVQALAVEFNEATFDMTSGRVYITSNEGKHKYHIAPMDEVFICANCGKVAKINGKRHRCRESNICPSCGCTIDKKIIEKYGNRGVCPSCWARQHSGFCSYSTKPQVDFLPHPCDLQDFGLEIEVDDPSGRGDTGDVCEEVGAILNTIEPYHQTFVTASDGSLYHGFELKTSPRPLAWFIKHKQTFCDAFNLIMERGYKGHDTNTAGLHISLNLAKRTQVYALKMAYFWSKNIKFFDIIARRVSTRSGNCYYQYKNLGERPLLDTLASKSHRDVVNLEHLDINRLEIRHFRSTLKVDTLIATLDIMQAVDKFLQVKTTEQILQGKYTLQEVINKLTTEEGKAYVNSKKEAFANAGYAVEVA